MDIATGICIDPGIDILVWDRHPVLLTLASHLALVLVLPASASRLALASGAPGIGISSVNPVGPTQGSAAGIGTGPGLSAVV